MLEQRELYRETINTFESDEELNVDLIEKILDECLPMNNKDDCDEDYAELLQDLNTFNVNKASELKDIVVKHLEKAIEVDKKEVMERIAKNEFIEENPERILKLKVFFKHVGLARQALEFEFGDEFNDYMRGKYADEYPEDWESVD